MTSSVSATELAKLGKCAAAVKPYRHNRRAKGRSGATQSSERALRGEFIHHSYETAVNRYMTQSERKKRTRVQLMVYGVFAAGLLSVMVLYVN